MANYSPLQMEPLDVKVPTDDQVPPPAFSDVNKETLSEEIFQLETRQRALEEMSRQKNKKFTTFIEFLRALLYTVLVALPFGLIATLWIALSFLFSSAAWLVLPLGILLTAGFALSWRLLAKVELFTTKLVGDQFRTMPPTAPVIPSNAKGFFGTIRALISDPHTWRSVFYFLIYKPTITGLMLFTSIHMLRMAFGLWFLSVAIIAGFQPKMTSETGNDEMAQYVFPSPLPGMVRDFIPPVPNTSDPNAAPSPNFAEDVLPPADYNDPKPEDQKQTDDVLPPSSNFEDQKHEGQKHEGQKHEGQKHEGQKHEGEKHHDKDRPHPGPNSPVSDVATTKEGSSTTHAYSHPAMPFRIHSRPHPFKCVIDWLHTHVWFALFFFPIGCFVAFLALFSTIQLGRLHRIVAAKILGSLPPAVLVFPTENQGSHQV